MSKNLKRIRIIAWAGVIVALALFIWTSYGAKQVSQRLTYRQAGPVEYGPAPAFVLTEQSGEAFPSESLAGKVWAAAFIFTRCQDECPLITARMKQAADILAAEGVWGTDVEFVSLSVDPAYDTPHHLDEYRQRYSIGTGWHFLTGEPETVLRIVTEGFQVGAMHYERMHGRSLPWSPPWRAVAEAHMPEEVDYDIIHTDRIAIVDRSGTLREFVHALESTPEEIADAVRRYL